MLFTCKTSGVRFDVALSLGTCLAARFTVQFFFRHMVSKEVLSTMIIDHGTFFFRCASLPFSAIKTHLHNERT